jgi:hypothetical protein
MPFADFLADPKGYLTSRAMQMAGVGHNLVPAALTDHGAVVNGAHGHTRRYSFAGNMHLTPGAHFGNTNPLATALRRIGVMHVRSVTYGQAPGGAHAGVRILPYWPAQVTCLRLDAGGGNFALTGPINGCTVAVGRDAGGGVWMFHANVGGALNAMNLMTKRAMTVQAGLLPAVGVPIGNLHYCEPNIGAGGFNYDGQGFVWGRPSGAVWKFYVHYIVPGALPGQLVVTNSKWAQI